ncbi:ATP-dependent helicase HrpB [Cohaesibacter sp. ES.047]|uniref:ATP-dependent helicase HrpB n=1 Tax=Cohaesibacter sp. ES.047 TaxID=1798205 RepID=UPI000BB6B640|nr:ATP-dependent helicase HrpB [Cohaesibacter sp. ES.047]SNY91800.1 ATP-dependent helicase HrpB [Cohaesibacter sp. ES.047]
MSETLPTFLPQLPIREALPDLLTALKTGSRAVLIAPPGAGKTTCVPLACLDQPWRDGRIIMLEPRRLAARAAAHRMADLLGEPVGKRVGYRVRMDSRISKDTIIEVVTEGIFARMIVDDPSLEGISAVLFDEFHERSLDADTSLAFTLEAQDALREDLRLIVMSATLDGGRVASILDDAPVIESMGRAYPVETRHIPRKARDRLEDAVTNAVHQAMREEDSSVLVFLPGQGEIHRVEERLAKGIDKDVILAPLYGAMDGRAQDRAIQPPPKGKRKIVLATSIAETSLTIDGVRIIIDAGLVRRPRYEPNLGISRLETVRVSRASADQRKGRAGRTEPGVCYRLWDQGQTAALAAFEPPEILETDLSRLVLDCALWGETDPSKLRWLDEPPAAGWLEAVKLLTSLNALDEDGLLTDHGRALADLPLPPRLAHMLVTARKKGDGVIAAHIAALLTEGGRFRHNDLRHLLQDLASGRLPRARDIKGMAKRWIKGKAEARIQPEEAGRILALAYPDRIAIRRGAEGRYLLASGRGGVLDGNDPLVTESFLVVADLQGSAGNARITLAAPIARKVIEEEFADLITEEEDISFDRQSGAVSAMLQTRLGRIVLAEKRLRAPSSEAVEQALIAAIRKEGLRVLPFTKELKRWRGRIRFLAEREDGWPDLSDQGLLDTLEDWLQPFLAGKTSLSAITAADVRNALEAQVPYDRLMAVEHLLPTHFVVPTGSKIPIDYDAENGPVLAVRVQELFGLATHPTIMHGKLPLLLHLLSPAHRPIQLTRDLPGFWVGSWKDVKADMRGQYPKHVWPDDPLNTQATRRAKPRK